MFNLDDLRSTLKKEIIDINEPVSFYLSGNPIFDAFVGAGGLPKNQLQYIWASESVGKSTLAIQFLVSYLKQNDKCVILYFDTEESVTKSRLESLGVSDFERLFIINPTSIEQAHDIIKRARSKMTNDMDLYVIWDTLSQTPSIEETNNEIKIGMQARAFTTMFKKLRFYDHKLTMFALNQYRADVSGNKYAPKEPPSCHIVKHKSYFTLYGSRKKVDELIDDRFGYVSRLQTVKSKIASPKREFEFVVTYTNGYDSILSLIRFLRSQKIIGKKGGGWFYFESDPKVTYRFTELYKYFLTDESVIKWKLGIERIFETLYPSDDHTTISEAKKRIFNYYFKNDKFDRDKFTSISESVIEENSVVEFENGIVELEEKIGTLMD